jgi:hypothetical protein
MRLLAATLLLGGCATAGQINYRSESGIGVMQAAIANVLSGGYAVYNREGVAIAICLPTGDPSSAFLASLNRRDLFPCSALQVRGGGTVRKLRGSTRRVWECVIDSVRSQGPGTAIVEGSCADESLSGGGFRVDLKGAGTDWVVVSGRSTWDS